MNDLTDLKRAAREEAAARRAAAHAQAELLGSMATAYLIDLFRSRGEVAAIAGYLPIRTEIDPVPAMTCLHEEGHRICVPVVVGRARPLSFRPWSPGCATRSDAFGVQIPQSEVTVRPQALIVPMLAFDGQRYRLGYGGGYYDRTIAGYRNSGGIEAIGLAYAAQQIATLPVDRTDMMLDAIVTELGVLS